MCMMYFAEKFVVQVEIYYIYILRSVVSSWKYIYIIYISDVKIIYGVSCFFCKK